MFRKKNRSKRRSRAMLSAYSIIMILIILLGILSHVLPKAKYAPLVVEDEVPTVEVGPGEWEGETADGGPEGLVDQVEDVTPVEEEPVLIAEDETVSEISEDETVEAEVEDEAEVTEIYETKANPSTEENSIGSIFDFFR